MSQAKYSRPSAALIALFACLLGAIAGCGSGVNPDLAAYISSDQNTLRAGETAQIGRLPASVTGTALVYSVNGVQGGSAKFGTVDGNGLYTAPAIVPSPSNVVTVTSVATNFPNGKPGSVAFTILNPIPVVASVTPSTFPEGTATVTVTGSQFVYGAQIYWNGAPVSTTYVSSTQLAASISAPLPGNYSLYVRNPEPGAANSAATSIAVTPGKVMLKVLTNDGTSVRVNNSLRIGLTVTGTLNTGVVWQVNGVNGGNAQLGTVVANQDGSATYTAPPVVPAPNIVLLTATSVDDPTVSIGQNIAVMNPIPILTSASPMTFSVGSATVVVTGDRFINGATVLMNGVAAPTTFNSATQLTATLTLTDPGNLDLQVLNPAPGPATSVNLIAQVSGNPPVPLVTPEDASRFLAQSTFGATDGDIRHLSKIGYADWFTEQFNQPPVPHKPYVEQQLIINNPPCASGDLKCNAALFVQNDTNEGFVQQSFWQQAIAGNDQLRQRVVYALTQIMVISSTNPDVENMPRGMANYYDVLGADAFGNFRQLIEDVTLSPMMGKFLSHLGNDKGDANRDPDENYAREVMQLFTIGLYQLNADGTRKLDTTGQPIPTYNNNDVMGLAKVLTGFSWNIPGNKSEDAWSDCCAYVGPGFGEDILPMQSFPNHHSIAEKRFLGVTIPASANPDPEGDLKIALDTIFNHPNLPPFFAKQMIQHMVTSNPSPAYVGRVAAVFQNNGFGVRGDMKAVITAILMDPEARDSATAATDVQYGKIREALIRYTEWARAFTAQSRNGSYNLGSTENPIYGLGEMSLRSPSVFNWFAPGYTPPGTSIEKAGLLAPEMQMTDVSTVVGYLNYMQNAIDGGAVYGPDVFSSYSTEKGLAATPDQLVDRINLLLMAGRMDNTLRSQIVSAVNAIAIPATGPDAIDTALSNRVKTAIYLTMAAPSYSAQF
ncbi:MAG: DUF1800 domain-containing protein [Acidobacteria bacterium]|nr:DUF1800 domain-containing protein [Acidobacteriota bacterium]